ncbi:uncharacterized protein BDV17DRAFT_4676 [Aspergillus undulatus]|uniref:uncharacterized protein n=1 Tax=Aspergillus undulatus TaxID=1810928 RepID=UPI003CCDD7B9
MRYLIQPRGRGAWIVISKRESRRAKCHKNATALTEQTRADMAGRQLAGREETNGESVKSQQQQKPSRAEGSVTEDPASEKSAECDGTRSNLLLVMTVIYGNLGRISVPCRYGDN